MICKVLDIIIDTVVYWL